MFDSKGQKIGRGTRVMVRFEDHGPEHLPFEWTGRVLGASKLDGRIRVQSEFVTWKGPLHLLPIDASLTGSITRLADQSQPIEYHEHRPNGRHHVRPIATY
jgi:hypothetical protein